MAVMFTASFAYASFKAFNSFYFVRDNVGGRGVERLTPVNNSMRHLVIPALFYPNLSLVDQLIRFWMTSTIEGHWPAGSFHSDERTPLVRITSQQIHLTVPFAHGQ